MNIPVVADQLQSDLDKLLQLRNQVAQVDKVIKTIATDLSGAIKDLHPDTVSKTDFGVLHYLTEKETTEFANIESVRLNLASSWRYLEERKRTLIETARGRAGQ